MVSSPGFNPGRFANASSSLKFGQANVKFAVVADNPSASALQNLSDLARLVKERQEDIQNVPEKNGDKVTLGFRQDNSGEIVCVLSSNFNGLGPKVSLAGNLKEGLDRVFEQAREFASQFLGPEDAAKRAATQRLETRAALDAVLNRSIERANKPAFDKAIQLLERLTALSAEEIQANYTLEGAPYNQGAYQEFEITSKDEPSVRITYAFEVDSQTLRYLTISDEENDLNISYDSDSIGLNNFSKTYAEQCFERLETLRAEKNLVFSPYPSVD